LPIWVVADGAYAKADFLKPAMSLGITVVSRLRKDAALRTLPGPRPAGKRGRPRTYGEDKIDLAKRGGQWRSWSSDTFDLYGEEVIKRYKTFLATWRPAGGAIRVVLVDEPTGWRAYFCTDTTASVADILGAVAAWAAPRKLVHLKWKSLGRLGPGGTREQETDRRRGDPIVEGRRPRPGQGADRLRLLPQGRRRPDHLPSLAKAA
jgi:hypothetical protein